MLILPRITTSFLSSSLRVSVRPLLRTSSAYSIAKHSIKLKNMSTKNDNPSVVLQKVGTITFEDRPVPEIKDPHFVKIAIKYTGLCGSDAHYYETGCCGSFEVTSPMTLGHESSGVIVEVGKEVKSLKVGDHVACEPGIPSRYSYEYKGGNYNLCPEMAFAATPPYDGTLCRYYLLPEDFCVKLPSNVSLEEGALVEPLSVGVHANRLISTIFGDRLVVFGAGPVGLLAAGAGKAFGATKVLIIDIVQDKLDFALKNGLATHAFNSRGKSLAEIKEYISKEWDGQKPTIGIDATGNRFCIANCIQLLQKRGRYCQVGMGAPTLDGFPIAYVAENEIIVTGGFRYGVDNYKTSVELIASGKINVKPLITDRFTFEESIKAYEYFKEGKSIKIMISGPE